MRYIESLNLIKLSIKYDILKKNNGKVLVFREASKNMPEGWYLTDTDELAKELMNDEYGQKMLISALKEKNIEFEIKNKNLS